MSPKTSPGQTRKQIYCFVRDRLLAGQPPTVREVQQAFGFRAVQTAWEHLEILVTEGKLAKEPGKARGLCLPREAGGIPWTLVPLLGRVQAGALSTAVQDPDGGYLRVQVRSPGDGLFALRVRGESMTGAGIFPGDLIIVRRQPSADPGDIVVALVDDEATVKRLRPRGKWVELVPENPAFAPIRVDGPGLVILGKVIEVRRYLEGPPLRAEPSRSPLVKADA